MNEQMDEQISKLLVNKWIYKEITWNTTPFYLVHNIHVRAHIKIYSRDEVLIFVLEMFGFNSYVRQSAGNVKFIKRLVYRMNDLVSIPDSSKNFFLCHQIQTGPGAQLASYRMDTRGAFLVR
jgi:hypothetical protein